MADVDVERLWAAWWADRTPATRESLMLAYQGLIAKLVRSTRYPWHVDHDDLMSFGQIGLIDAITSSTRAVA